jgi:hypothetical protein
VEGRRSVPKHGARKAMTPATFLIVDFPGRGETPLQETGARSAEISP